jgi:hypothetical protein
LAVFGRRPPQRVDSLVMPASENLHRTGRGRLSASLYLRYNFSAELPSTLNFGTAENSRAGEVQSRQTMP